MTTHTRRVAPAHRRRSRGITTIEVLVGSVVSLIVLLAVVAAFDAQQKTYATLQAYSRSQDVTRTAIELISRDVRMSSYDPTGVALALSPPPTCPNVPQGLVVAGPNQIQIQQDLDADGLLATPGENIRYFVSGSEIRRLDVSGGNTLATLVSGVAANGLQIRYFDGASPPNELVPAGSPPALTQTQRACVEKVQVRIAAQIPSPVANRDPLTSVVESGVAIRNRSLQRF